MRDCAAPPERQLADLAARQYGVVAVGQLHAIGLDGDAIARRVASGRLHRLHRGVYAVGHTSSAGTGGTWPPSWRPEAF